MAEFLDKTGLQALWTKIKTEDSKRIAATEKGAANGVATLDANGKIPVAQLANLDTTFAEIVTELPTSGIKKHLYLVKADNSTTQNTYKEYYYTGDTAGTYDSSKWEQLGEYKPEVDLSGYAKKSEAMGSLTQAMGVSSYSVYFKSVSGTDLGSFTISNADGSQNGLMSATDKSKLNGIAAGAEVNQKAFSNVVVGTTTVASNEKTGSLTLSGSNVTLTPNALTRDITIGITKANVTAALGYTPAASDTHYSSKNVVGASATASANAAASNGSVYLNHLESNSNTPTSSHKIVGTGATTVASDANGNITISSTNTTYGTATTSANGLMSSSDKSKLDGVAAGATADSAISTDYINALS